VSKAQALLGRIEAIRGVIEDNAQAHDEATELAPAVIEALEQAGVFELMAPAELGGVEAHPLEAIAALSRLSYFDGSTGWYCQAATTGVAVAGAFMGERAVEEIFGAGKKPTCAGQAAPTGKAEREGEGYRLSGSFSFGSGLPNANWFVGGYILHESGVPVQRDGMPVMLIALVPRERAEVRGNWNVLGLRGTGSYDFHVPEQWVHADFTLDAGNPVPRRGGPLYRMGFLAIPTLCHASFALGCTERMLDEWVLHAQAKHRVTGGALAEGESFQNSLGRAHARFRSARAYVLATFAALAEGAAQGQIADQLKLDVRLCTSNAVSTGAAIAQEAFTSSATTGLRNGNRLQRCYRDLQAANAHFLTGEQSFIDAGRYLAGLPGSSPGM
jgi:alkylation response protein AidB-like acyl-CoA dehydrogenase